ncbi:MAG: hypothetical protein ACE149_19605 [Armatimonadota bacterium]
MRLDARVDREALDYDAFLDGERLEDCVVADEEEGLALCYVTEGDQIVMDWDAPGEPAPSLSERRGRVELRPKRNQEATCRR